MTTPTAPPTITRAAVLREHGAALSLETIELPSPEPGAAIIEVQAATLCGSDAELWTGAMGWPGMLPIVLGHETAGVVVAVGDGCRDALGEPIRVGDRIMTSESVCGHCRACTLLGTPVACENRGYGMRQRADRPPYVVGGLSDYSYVTPASQIVRIDDRLEPSLAAAAGCALKTVIHAVDRMGGIRAGHSVVIQGAGALGLFAAAVARIHGARSVTVIGGPQNRLDLARRFGADVTLGLDSDPAERVAAVLDATGGIGADRVLDLAGAPGIADEAVRMAAQNGAYAVVGTTSDRPAALPLGMVMRKQLTVAGAVNGDASHLMRALDLLVTHADAAPWSAVLDAPVGLEAAADAVRALAEQRSIKPVIDPRRDRPGADRKAA